MSREMWHKLDSAAPSLNWPPQKLDFTPWSLGRTWKSTVGEEFFCLFWTVFKTNLPEIIGQNNKVVIPNEQDHHWVCFSQKYPKIVWVVSLKGLFFSTILSAFGGYIGAPTAWPLLLANGQTNYGTMAAMAQALFHASGSPFIVSCLAEELFNRRTSAHTGNTVFPLHLETLSIKEVNFKRLFISILYIWQFPHIYLQTCYI